MKSLPKLRATIARNRRDVAVLIGNGINRYGNKSSRSWADMIQNLIARFQVREQLGLALDLNSPGIALTEVYDLIGLLHHDGKILAEAEKFVCDWLRGWQPGMAHENIVRKARTLQVPILTTNFDLTLEAVWQKNNASYYRRAGQQGSFGHYYPWASYAAPEELASPTTGFAVWHLHGSVRYRKSLRIGLSHYMGAVAKARPFIASLAHQLWGKNGKPSDAAKDTWLEVFFARKLMVLGLRLDEKEVFLRWLFIQRAKWRRRFLTPQSRSGWFVHVRANKEDISSNQRLFLESVGLEIVELDTFDDAYGGLWS